MIEHLYESCMLSSLADAIEDLQVPLHGEPLGELFHLIDRLQAKAHAAVGEYDAQGLFALDGAVSMTAGLDSTASPIHIRS